MKAGPIDISDHYALGASLGIKSNLDQLFTSTRPHTSESYLEDLDEFLCLLKERRSWFRMKKYCCDVEYITIPTTGVEPSRFILYTSFRTDAVAASYRRHFNP